MNYTISYDKTDKDEACLVVTQPGGWFGAPETQVVKVITGEEATELFKKLTAKKVSLNGNSEGGAK